jgi:hypothetical protein
MTARDVSLRNVVVGALLLCLPVCASCKPKDSPLRTYIRDDLEPYLDSLAYQLCQVKYLAAPQAPGRVVCPGPPEGYKKPPGNGAP